MKSYTAIRGANVGATAELIRLCLPRRVPFHFISSPSVGLFSGEANPELYPERAPGAPKVLSEGTMCDSGAANSGHGGYMVSKWACEKMLERTNQLHHLPVWTHRPSTILREGQDAEEDRARLDWLNGLLQYARILQAVPKIGHVKGALDMVHVRTVCAGILDAVLGETQPGFQGAEYVHEVGDIVVPLGQLERLLALEINQPLGRAGLSHGITDCEVLPMGEWLTRATEAGLHPAVAMLIENMDTPGNPSFPALKKSARGT
ncbi:hypothetical protein F5Y14DRAFT_450818 [Nemania sp. NC0429]|nr:hypothetical protein F5Y14DRAFT_450818 [Nemania sp. NC0429]